VAITEIEARSILRKHKRIDSWFISSCGMNLYRGCLHDCAYCDGRAEGYYVEGEFGRDVTVKVNAVEILRRELDPRRRRKPLRRGFFMIGSGVGDAYQPPEETYKLARQTLQLMDHYRLPVHLLTKSGLIKRDIDILKRINETSRAIVSFSLSSVDEHISGILEPGVPPPRQRLETLSFFKSQGIAAGVFLLPVIPFLTDTAEMMEKTLHSAKQAGADFVVFGGLTLKPGRQREHFLRVLDSHYPHLKARYRDIYTQDKWGQARPQYYSDLHLRFYREAKHCRIPLRIPAALYRDILDDNDLVMVILEHMDYLLKLQGQKSPYGYAAYSLSRLNAPLSTLKEDLETEKGINKAAAAVIRDIQTTGTSPLYEKLMGGPAH
jgi:DNA repair photolyase